jgi:hypothetical protein
MKWRKKRKAIIAEIRIIQPVLQRLANLALKAVNESISDATKGKYENINQLAKEVSSRANKTCDGCGYPVNDNWKINLTDRNELRRNPEMPECTGNCPRCGKYKELEV